RTLPSNRQKLTRAGHGAANSPPEGEFGVRRRRSAPTVSTRTKIQIAYDSDASPIPASRRSAGIAAERQRVGARLRDYARKPVMGVFSKNSSRGFAPGPQTQGGKDSRGKRPGDPEAQVVAPAVGRIIAAAGRAGVAWKAVPGPAAHHPATWVGVFFPL